MFFVVNATCCKTQVWAFFYRLYTQNLKTQTYARLGRALVHPFTPVCATFRKIIWQHYFVCQAVSQGAGLPCAIWMNPYLSERVCLWSSKYTRFWLSRIRIHIIVIALKYIYVTKYCKSGGQLDVCWNFCFLFQISEQCSACLELTNRHIAYKFIFQYRLGVQWNVIKQRQLRSWSCNEPTEEHQALGRNYVN